MLASRRPTLPLILCAAGSLLMSCTSTEPPAPAAARISPDILQKLPPATIDPARMEWAPDSGRLGEATRRRHLLPSPHGVLWSDRFNAPDPQLPAGWTSTGQPRISSFGLDALTGAELAAADNDAECTLERRLNPERLAGRDVRLSVQIACPSPRRLEQLRNVRVSIVSSGQGGRPTEILLPLAVDISPGWETIDWPLRFSHNLNDVALRVHLPPEAALIVHHVTMTRLDPAPAEGAVATGAPISTPPSTQPDATARNLIVGGNFETGRRMFFASHLHAWPNGDRTATPLAFEYENQGPLGQRSLKLQIPTGTGRIGFGPLDLASAEEASTKRWYLNLHARASRPTAVIASLRTAQRTLAEATFTVDAQWQAFAREFRLVADTPAERQALRCAELILDIPAEAGEPLECGLDAVSLTDAPSNTFHQADAIELGITGPAPLTTDLANIVAEEEVTLFTIDLVADPAELPAIPDAESKPRAARPAGQLALDVLDAWDRVVWSRTTEPLIPPEGRYSEQVSISLPRGYYRLLATLWSGTPGESRRISHHSCPVAVISFEDPVPLGNRYGLTSDDENVSGYTTALGAGWVRMNLAAQKIETASGAWDFSLWQRGFNAAKEASVELLAAVTLPTVQTERKIFLTQWLANTPLQPIGLVVNPPTISARPAEEYREQLEWAGELLAGASPHARLVFDLSTLEAQPKEPVPWPVVPHLVVGYAGTETTLPEGAEPLLENIGQRYAEKLRVWDLAVPVRIGSNRTIPACAISAGDGTPAVSPLDGPLDPALFASRMIRSILNRALAGAQLVCLEAVALQPPRSLYEPDSDRLHEVDLTPRPALVAYERMTSLLNDATLVKWIDQPDGSRMLLFEKDDGGAVAVIWRPFGFSPTFLSFAGLPSNIEVLDCFGMPEPLIMAGNVRLIPANEMVRYIVAAPEQTVLLAEAVQASRIRLGPATP